jgi:histone deacetylase 11
MFAHYHPRVDFTFPGLSRFHPANLRKYRQAVSVLSPDVAVQMTAIEDRRPDLNRIHDAAYLDKALSGEPDLFAEAAEVPQLKRAPAWLIRRAIVRPMLAAVSLTISAARAAWREKQVVFAVGGGFHHAKPSKGEGFCIFNDVATAIAKLRQSPGGPETIAYIDVDAHMGNGVAHCFLNDPSVKLFDLYSDYLYPVSDTTGSSRFDYGVAISDFADIDGYLYHLRSCLGPWIDMVQPDMVFVNVGQDVLESDPLTFFNLSLDDVRERDRLIAEVIAKRRLPAVFVAGGGYTKEASTALAGSITVVHETCGLSRDRHPMGAHGHGRPVRSG